MKVFIDSIGLQAPGLEGWHRALPILRGEQPYVFTPLSPYAPSFLPANERRRTTETIRLGLRSAQATLDACSAPVSQTMPTLFACVDGDTEISAKMTSAILADEPMVSPIHFHNSVHNAPAGYWMIGQKNTAPSSSISVGAYQVANSFLEAITQLAEGHEQLLLVMYDLPIDPIIESYQPPMTAFGVGFLLSAQPSPQTLAGLQIQWVAQPCETAQIVTPFGENAAAQVWPLLQGLAQQAVTTWRYPLSDCLSADITLTPMGELCCD